MASIGGTCSLHSRKSLDDETEATLWQPANVWDDMPDSISERLERNDGKVDPWAPKHVYVPKQLVDFVDTGPNLHIKIGDPEGAYFVDNPPSGQRTPWALRAPELFFAKNISDATKDGRQLDLRSRLYFRESKSGERIPYCANLGGMDEVGSDEEPFVPDPYPMEKFFNDAAPNLAKADEGVQIKKLIRQILQYHPTKRPTVAEILEDRGLKESDDVKEKEKKKETEKEKGNDSSKYGDNDDEAAYEYDADEYDEDDIEKMLQRTRKGKGKEKA
ncbi:hypothetical protein Sste5346_009355 [Sporothrix stenoceras]|uniref:Protein kinase domain-containing protein n=1 Tax=Sporothrix stenoceras TaxID=5173 RepID=A0ABR3YK84_9PEZI